MKIISLYPNEVYQVVSEDESSVYFQGNDIECLRYLLKYLEHKQELNKSE
jgi:hypothetical protein